MSFLATLIQAQQSASTSNPVNRFLVFVDNERIEKEFYTQEDVDAALIEIVKSKIPNVNVKIIDLQEGKVIVDETLNVEVDGDTLTPNEMVEALGIKNFESTLLESDFAIEVKIIPISEDTALSVELEVLSNGIQEAIEELLEDYSSYQAECTSDSIQYAVKI